MKRNKLLFLFLLVLAGCSYSENVGDFKMLNKAVENEHITIKELAFEQEKMNNLYPNLHTTGIEEGISLFNMDENNSYLLFNSKVVHYDNFSFHIKDRKLVIAYTSTSHISGGEQSFFKITKRTIQAFDTIVLINNGETDSFQMVYA
ncbi:hypothetical protein [Bacillus sp. 1P06AnD]|uniref:hypothetical protein n=1 Tax=Bacillus sp. 1P06AnD TaxID=3132208 RepID=UPI0039A189C0